MHINHMYNPKGRATSWDALLPAVSIAAELHTSATLQGRQGPPRAEFESGWPYIMYINAHMNCFVLAHSSLPPHAQNKHSTLS